MQMVMGVICAMFGIVLITIKSFLPDDVYGSPFGAGIWVGSYVSSNLCISLIFKKCDNMADLLTFFFAQCK